MQIIAYIAICLGYAEKDNKKARLLPRVSLRGALRSFNFSAFNASGANVFFGNSAVLVFNANLLEICFVKFGGFTVGVAHGVAGKFAFTANAAYFTHIFILRLEYLFFQQQILYHIEK